MNVNFGLFPPPPKGQGRPPKGRARKQAMSRRALDDLQGWLGGLPQAAE